MGEYKCPNCGAKMSMKKKSHNSDHAPAGRKMILGKMFGDAILKLVIIAVGALVLYVLVLGL